MQEPYANRFWAENHQVLSGGIDRGFSRIARALRRLIGHAVSPDKSEEARKRTYSIG